MIQSLQIRLLTLLIITLPCITHAQKNHIDEREFALANIEQLSIHMDHVDILLKDNQANQLTVSLVQKIERGSANKCLQQLTAKRSGKTLTLNTKQPRSSFFDACKVTRKVTLSVDQSALKQFKLAHNHGSFRTENMSVVNVDFNISHSDIKIKQLNATSANINLAHTDANINKAKITDEFNIKGSHGDFTLTTTTGDTLQAHWQHGKIVIGTSATQQLTVKQAHGGMHIGQHTGAIMNLENQHGSIYVDNTNVKTATISNQHNKVYFSGNSKNIAINNQHGSVKLVQTASNYDRIETKNSHGNIDIRIPPQSVCTLDGETKSRLSNTLFNHTDFCTIHPQSGKIAVSTKFGKTYINAL